MLCGNKAYSCWVVDESRTGHHCIPELAALQVVVFVRQRTVLVKDMGQHLGTIMVYPLYP